MAIYNSVFLPCIDHNDHVTPGLQELNWLSIENLLIYKDTIMTYKCLNNLVPSYLANKFTKRSDIHDCQTRNNHC